MYAILVLLFPILTCGSAKQVPVGPLRGEGYRLARLRVQPARDRFAPAAVDTLKYDAGDHAKERISDADAKPGAREL